VHDRHVGEPDDPIVHLSVTWWRGLHQGPTVKLPSVTLAPIMTLTLMISLTSFTILYAYLMTLRLRVGRLEERALAEALSPRLGQPAAALIAADDDGRHDLPDVPMDDALEEQGAPRA